jgi:7,8-dihydro-6-hydroxymethylpterin dimethyltransferase
VIREAVTHRCVRGVTIQPVQHAGRTDGFDPATDRLTLTEVRTRILEQCEWFKPTDIVPVPCHPDCIAMAYALRTPTAGKGKAATPLTTLTGMVPPAVLLAGLRSTIAIEKDQDLQTAFKAAFSTSHSPESAAECLSRLMCCLPGVDTTSFTYKDVFRVVIMQFLDQHSMDLRSVRRTCVHIAHPDGKRIIPFDTYNLFYRDDLEQRVLAPLRAQVPT